MATPLLTLTRAHSRLIRSLLQEKNIRTREGAFVIEGARFCQDVIRHHPGTILSLTISSRYLQQEQSADRRLRAHLPARQFTCSEREFTALSDVDTPQGILAVVRQPQWDEARIWAQPRVLGLYGEHLQDPLNVGAIIRTSAALGLTGLWLSSDSADCFGPKVVRAAAGSVLAFPVFRAKDHQTFGAHDCAVFSAVVSGAETVSLRRIRTVPPRLVVAVGNEGRGLADGVVRASALTFSIPLARDVQSLNVAATAAIAAFYLSGLPVASSFSPR